jgi:hypothetical protein
MTIKDIEARLAHYERMFLAGDPMPEGASFGPPVQIWRLHRDGHESWETLPEFLAELVLADIVNSEPNVARAKIVRSSPNLDQYLLVDIFDLMARQPAMVAA